MATHKPQLPLEILQQIARNISQFPEVERRTTLVSLVCADSQFRVIFTPFLYNKYEHIEGSRFDAPQLRGYLSTITDNIQLANHIQEVIVVKWVPRLYHYPPMRDRPNEMFRRLLEVARNVRELRIRLPYESRMLYQPFLELRKLHLLAWSINAPWVIGGNEFNEPPVAYPERALYLACLDAVLGLPKLTDLKLEAMTCGEYVRSVPPSTSNITSLEIHSGDINTATVTNLLKCVVHLKIFRFSSMVCQGNTSMQRIHPDTTPSTQRIGEALERHKGSLQILELTKHFGLNVKLQEVIETLESMEQLKSLCIESSMLLGRWHCKHPAERVQGHGQGQGVTILADIDKALYRHPMHLVECLPSALEELVLGIDDDRSDTFILDILSGIVKQRERLSALRRIAFYRNNVFYCHTCKKEVGICPTNLTDNVGEDRADIWERERTFGEQVIRLIEGTDLKVYLGLQYQAWSERTDLWDKAGMYLTGESSIDNLQFRELAM